jgi:hypothetical protein
MACCDHSNWGKHKMLYGLLINESAGPPRGYTRSS